MRTFIALDTFGGPCRMTWNSDSVQLTFEFEDDKGNPFTLSFDGKEALKVLSFVNSL